MVTAGAFVKGVEYHVDYLVSFKDDIDLGVLGELLAPTLKVIVLVQKKCRSLRQILLQLHECLLRTEFHSGVEQFRVSGRQSQLPEGFSLQLRFNFLFIRLYHN